MTQREEFCLKYEQHSGLPVFFDDYGTPYVSASMDDLIANSMVRSAWWGWKAAKAQAVPKGWKLVPVEPTHEMFCAGYHELEQSESIEAIYKTMLEAAPEQNK